MTVRDGFDAQGDLSTATDDTITVTINLTNLNDPPSIVSGARNPTVSENRGSTTQTYTANDPDAGATLSWSLGGVDSGAFSVSTFTSTTNPEGQGVIRFLEPPDYELPTDDDKDNVYHLTLTVADNGNPPITDTWDITVTVTNVDEAGTVTITGTPSGGEQLTATVADEDGTVSSLTWQWSRQAPLGLFIPITGATSDSYTPVAADVARYVQVTASYSDGLGPLETASAVTSSVVGASNAEPAFDEGASATPHCCGEQHGGHERRECGGGHGQRQRHADLLAERRARVVLHHRLVERPDQDRFRRRLRLRGQEQLQRHRKRARREGHRQRL